LQLFTCGWSAHCTIQSVLLKDDFLGRSMRAVWVDLVSHNNNRNLRSKE
jgi:hypothetical protein